MSEGWDTDGSQPAQEERLRRHLQDCERDRALLEARITQGLIGLDGMIDHTKPGPLRSELRRIRMALAGGMKRTQTERAEKLVEEWLQDPHRNVFGLAADLLHTLGEDK